MANEKLENLVRIRQLKAEPAAAEEISGLLRSGVVRLADAKNTSLSKESRFDLAYNAAIDRKAAISCSSVRSTQSVLLLSIGEFSIRRIENAIWRSMKATSTLRMSFSRR